MGNIFGAAKKGFGMLKKSKDSSKLLKRRKELGGLKSVDWDAFKKANRPPPGVPGTEKAKQKIVSDFVKIRKRTKPAWKKKKLHPMDKAKGGAVKKPRPGYGPTGHSKRKVDELDRDPPKTKETKSPWEKAPRMGRPAGRSKKSGPHDRHPESRRRMGPAAGRPPAKRPTPMSK